MKEKYNSVLKSAKDLLVNMDADEFLDKFLNIQNRSKRVGMFKIDIAKDFSVLPKGRYHSDGPNCAEALFINIQDVLDYESSVELVFNGKELVSVGSTFLCHLALMVVTWNYQDIVFLTSDDEWILSRYYKYLEKWEQQGGED